MKSYAVADVALKPDEAFFERIGRLAAAGVEFIQLRAKDASGDELLEWAREALRRIGSNATRLMINSNAAVARQAGAAGVHLPSAAGALSNVRRDHPSLTVGRSCHTVSDCVAAAAEGADYVLLGPAFPPRSKQGAAGVTVDEYRQAASLGVDVYALGGVSADNLVLLAGLGLAGVAAVTLFMRDEPLERIVEEIHRL